METLQIFEARKKFVFKDPIGAIAGRCERIVDEKSLWKRLGTNGEYMFVECIKSNDISNVGIQIGLDMIQFTKLFTEVRS